MERQHKQKPLLIEGARQVGKTWLMKEFEMAIMWLSDCSIIHRVNRTTAPRIPLKAYDDIKAFKLFLSDVGLLCARTILEGNELFTESNGALTEQFILQELLTLSNIGIYYYTNERSNAEIDFILDIDNSIIPLEVKAETNLKAKSLKVYIEKYKPPIATRSSMADYRQEENPSNLPLYAIESIQKEIERRLNNQRTYN